MNRLKLTLEYAGTRYSGWQIQTNARTVQGVLERAIQEATGVRTFELYASGRTDAGVHALGQVAHLDIATTLPPDVLLRRVNDLLPADVNVLAIERAARRFHARHDAVGRRYLYQISRRRTAFGKAFVWWVKDPLDAARMREAAGAFVGFHDFQSFSDDDPAAKSTLVQVDALEIRDADDRMLIHLEASHFLWKMVRRIVGVLVEIGRGGLTAAEAAQWLQTRSPAPARLTAPAAGLFLERVYYPGDARDRRAAAGPRTRRPPGLRP